jgi:hypothetical protein
MVKCSKLSHLILPFTKNFLYVSLESDLHYSPGWTVSRCDVMTDPALAVPLLI